MAEKSGLFNAVAGSPAYNDVDMATMFSLLTGGQGYLVDKDNELEVTAGTGLEVIVDTGAAWIGEPTGWWYINDEAKHLTLDAESEGLSRIDRIVLRLDRNTDALKVTAVILKGNPAASDPVAPSLTQDSMVYELSLAQVLVTGGSTAITVTDERMKLVQSNLVFTLADCGLTDADFAGKTWVECALIIVNNCPTKRVIQWVSTSIYPNLSTALVAVGLPALGALRFEPTYPTMNEDQPNKFEYNGNNGGGNFIGFYDNEWRGWRRLDSGDVYKTASFTLDASHQQCFIRCNGTMTVTVPADIFPVNTDITIYQHGTGQVTIANGAGVTLYPTNMTTFKTREQGEAVVLRHFSSNLWAVMGADKS